jgi:hypothetical protein
MKSTIFIPKTIKVGFQNRSDTYTKKLAYVIYYDQHNKLRKENSWQNWRDKNIPDLEFPNEPTSGFVLNKRVGGYDTGWNHRNTYCRVYDNRDFEFEITIENLLYILENTSSIKGKGLEGQFVYGWDGKDLLLIPTDSPDYKELTQYNEILHSKNYIKAKDLIIGATYKTKNNEEWIYMGRFDKWHTRYNYKYDEHDCRKYNDYTTENTNEGKHHFFAAITKKYSWQNEPQFELLIVKNLGEKIISIISSDCVENYADLMDKLERKTEYSPINDSKTEYIPYTIDEFKEKFNDDNGWFRSYWNLLNKEIILKKLDENKCYYETSIRKQQSNRYYDYRWETIKTEKTFEEMYNEIQPKYQKIYLQNNKLYQEVK